jgi:hypothetical protein
MWTIKRSSKRNVFTLVKLLSKECSFKDILRLAYNHVEKQALENNYSKIYIFLGEEEIGHLQFTGIYNFSKNCIDRHFISISLLPEYFSQI